MLAINAPTFLPLPLKPLNVLLKARRQHHTVGFGFIDIEWLCFQQWNESLMEYSLWIITRNYIIVYITPFHCQ